MNGRYKTRLLLQPKDRSLQYRSNLISSRLPPRRQTIRVSNCEIEKHRTVNNPTFSANSMLLISSCVFRDFSPGCISMICQGSNVQIGTSDINQTLT
jgi:hypothetical protein